MAGKGGIADAHFADLGESGLQSRQKLRFHLTGDIFRLVVLTDVAADVGVEQQGVLQPDAVLAEAADADVNVDASPLIHHPEGTGLGVPYLLPVSSLVLK